MFLYQSGEALILHHIYLSFLMLSSCRGYSCCPFCINLRGHKLVLKGIKLISVLLFLLQMRSFHTLLLEEVIRGNG